MPTPRFFASRLAAIVLSGTALLWAQDASAVDFLEAIEDIPLPAGVREGESPVDFSTSWGRVIQADAHGDVKREDVVSFYSASLPSLGWTRTSDDGLIFERRGEALEISLENGADDQLLIRFKLIAPPASSRME